MTVTRDGEPETLDRRVEPEDDNIFSLVPVTL